MTLVQEIIKGLLPEQEKKKTVAVYAGGFKPPTAGHFEVVQQALEKNPEIEEFIIFIGNKERNGISQAEALLIWEIYNNYLPLKVKIELTSIPPIKAVYDYSRNNPTKEVLWVIGAREGNDADFNDIKNRTKSISDYPNLELRTTVTKGGVSGTAARNAALTSLDKFKKFVPDELSDKETEEVFNLVAGKITEGRKKKKDPKKGTGKKPKGSGRRLYTDEDPSDTVGIKFSTRQDIVNTLNKKSFKAKSHARQSQIINLIHQRVRAALGRTKDPKKKAKLQTGFKYIKKRKEASKAKTQRLKKKKLNEIGIDLSNYSGQILPGDVLRAPKGFPLGGKKLEKSIQLKVIKNSREGVNRYKLSLEDNDGKKYSVRNFEMDGEYKGKKLPKWGLVRKSKKNINEAIDSSKFDFRPYIVSLTQHMTDNGLKLEPLPQIQFIHDDVENGEDLFGKTAYYAPQTNIIVLFTYGRHPKDILRSYAHELIHVHQNMEDRLHNINTTDVNDDDYLEQLEREAYETGNIMFRSWTDSLTGNKLEESVKKLITEKKKKDPFGLNAYALELARGLEEQTSEYKVYLDMDGVLANFDQRFKDISGMEPKEFEAKYGKKAFWNLIDEDNKVSFWVGIPVMPGAKELVNAVKKYNYELLTAPSVKKQSYLGKILWVRNHSDVLGGKPRINFKKASEKHLVKPELTEKDILVDDREDTVERWNAAGGTGIHYRNVSQVLNDLGKLGL